MLIESLLKILPDNYTVFDRDLVMRAYRYAETAHAGQKRASGEPYVTHCVAVAGILAEMNVPATVVTAGLLHDTVEDTDVTLNDIKREFGEETAKLVDGGPAGLIERIGIIACGSWIALLAIRLRSGPFSS